MFAKYFTMLKLNIVSSKIRSSINVIFLVFFLIVVFFQIERSRKLSGLKVLIYTACIPSGFKSFDCDRIKTNRVNYAKAVRQTTFIQSVRPNNTKHLAWLKIKDFKEVSKGYDWVWILDADALIMNRRISVESLILGVQDLYSREIDIIISKDVISFNSGSFFLRNSDWSRRFVEKWLEYEDDTSVPKIETWWEQAALLKMYDDNELDVKNHLVEVRQSLINSYANRDDSIQYQYMPGDLAVHSPGPGYLKLIDFLESQGFNAL
jgi:hypothetical protein